MAAFSLNGTAPRIADPARCWIAPGAQVIGDVLIGLDVSIWFNAVLRGDNGTITIGDRCNIQDGAIVHLDPGIPATIGAGVTVGHRAIVHGATVGEGSLIGMGATLLNRSVIGADSLVGAHALVTEGKVFPPGVLIVGSPAKVARELTPEEIAGLRASSASYVANLRRFATGLAPVQSLSTLPLAPVSVTTS
jgi:carbonic anhydrase/acetyltransferase-like protein (isoleucine patch superfamily)